MATPSARPIEAERSGAGPGGSGPEGRTGSGSGGLAPFASRAYRYLFVGTAVMMASFYMQQIAQGWLIYDLTDSPVWLGIVSFARGIPMLVLALPGGVVVDRFDRRIVLIVSQALTALIAVVLAVLIATGQIQPWHVVATALAGGCLFVLVVPARQALVPATVEREQLSAAIALMSAGQNGGRVVGPSLAGMLIAGFGVAASFAVQAAGFLLALLCAAMLPPQPAASQTRQHSAAENLLEGLRYVWEDPTVLALFGLQAIPAVLIMPYTQLLPIFARDYLHAGPEGLGTLLTALGVGSMLGSFGIVLVPQRRQGAALFASLGAFGLLLVAFAASDRLLLSIGIMGLIGVVQAIYLATNTTLIQLTVPDALRGRVMSVYLTTWGLMPLGALPQGLLVDWLGAPIVVAGTGLLSVVVLVVLAARSPALRRL
jgi:MFS family permease